MLEKFSYKKFFIDFGILVLLISVSFLIIIYSIKLSRKSWQTNLKVSVEKVLDEYDANTWTVGNFIPINNPFSLTAACYETQNRKTGNVYKAIIIRIETYYGPLPAVFLVSEDNNVEFIGYSSLHGRILKQLINKPSDKRIDFWKEKVIEILG
ncbi:MAG: hypothetical protein K5866_01130 [Treponema sp.]|nr:hypothetical protein [Treponema sp.]